MIFFFFFGGGGDAVITLLNLEPAYLHVQKKNVMCMVHVSVSDMEQSLLYPEHAGTNLNLWSIAEDYFLRKSLEWYAVSVTF